MTRRFIKAISAVGLSGVLCLLSAAPVQADKKGTWESRDLGLSQAHRVSQGKGVTVAVLDTGVEKDHPAVKGRVKTGPDYVGDGLRPGDPKWGEHGTAMASNVLQVAPEASILSVRVIDDNDANDGKLTSGPDPLVRGIDYALAHGADVISLSLGGGSIGSAINRRQMGAMGRAASAGVPVLAGAGNLGDELNEISYPAGFPHVISVAAVGKNGKRAPFSNVRTYNAISAPGVAIHSAKNTGGWEKIEGTSSATALASGTVALMLAEQDLTPAQVREILTSTARHPAGGYNPQLGHGRINTAAAVRAAADPPADSTVPAKYEGKEHLATPNGIPPRHDAPLPAGELVIYLLVAGVGVAMVVGAFLIPRRARHRDTAAPAGFTGRPF